MNIQNIQNLEEFGGREKMRVISCIEVNGALRYKGSVDVSYWYLYMYIFIFVFVHSFEDKGLLLSGANVIQQM